jgi:hypothetical protein
LRHDAGQKIRRTAGREGHDDADRTRGIGLTWNPL